MLKSDYKKLCDIMTKYEHDRIKYEYRKKASNENELGYYAKMRGFKLNDHLKEVAQKSKDKRIREILTNMPKEERGN